MSSAQTAYVKFSWSLATFKLGGQSHLDETNGRQLDSVNYLLTSWNFKSNLMVYKLLMGIAKNQCFLVEVFSKRRL